MGHTLPDQIIGCHLVVRSQEHSCRTLNNSWLYHIYEVQTHWTALSKQLLHLCHVTPFARRKAFPFCLSTPFPCPCQRRPFVISQAQYLLRRSSQSGVAETKI